MDMDTYMSRLMVIDGIGFSLVQLSPIWLRWSQIFFDEVIAVLGQHTYIHTVVMPP